MSGAEDWNICASDEEWSSYEKPMKINNTDITIPEKLAKLFTQIDEKKVLMLHNCECPRKGKKQVKEINTQPSIISPIQSQPMMKEEKTPAKSIKDTKTTAADFNKTLEAFDFDDDIGGKPSSVKRKTPAGAKRVKKEKVASMSNVMNDLIRHKLLDELEAKENDNMNTAKEK